MKTDEVEAKRFARMRDGHRCRFPLCGCRRFRFRLEVSHQQHKGMGGNPSGSRSTAAGLITFCVHRHQDGFVSIHKGTLRIRPLTPKGCNGPVAFDVDNFYQGRRAGWYEIARESAVQQLEPLSPQQRHDLENLAQMRF